MDNWNYISDAADEIDINMRKKAIFSIFVYIFIHLFILIVTANFVLLAIKWPKILVLTVMPTPSPPPI